MQSRVQLNQLPYEIIWGIFNFLPIDFIFGVFPLIDVHFYQMIANYKSRYFKNIILQAVSDRIRASFLLNSLKPIVEDNLFFDSELKSNELNNDMLKLIYQVLTSQNVAGLSIKKEEIDSIKEIILNKIKTDLKEDFLWKNLLTSLEFWFLSTAKQKSLNIIKRIEGLIAFNENVFFNLSGLDLSGFDFSCLSLFGCYTTGCNFKNSKLESLFTNFVELSDPETGVKNLFILPNYQDFEFNFYFDNRIINSNITLYIWHLINTSKKINQIDKNKALFLLSHIENKPNLSILEINKLYCFSDPSMARSEFEISITFLFEKIQAAFKERNRHHTADNKIELSFDNKKLESDYIKQWKLRLFEQGEDYSWIIDRLSQMTPNDSTWMAMLAISKWMEGFWDLKKIPVESVDSIESAVLKKFKEMINLVFPKKIFSSLIQMMHLFISSKFFQSALSREEFQGDIKEILLGIQMKIQALLNEKEIINAKRLLHLVFSFDIIQLAFLQYPDIEKAYYDLEYQIYLQTVNMNNRKIIVDCRAPLKTNWVNFFIKDTRYIFPHVCTQLIVYLINDCQDMKAAFEYYQAMTQFNRVPLAEGDDLIFKGIYTTLMSYLREYLKQSIPDIARGEQFYFEVVNPKLYPKIKEVKVKLGFNTATRFSFFESNASSPQSKDAEKRNESKKSR